MVLVKKQKSPQGWIETVPTAAATTEENGEEEEKVKRLEELTSSDKKIEQSIQVFNFSFFNLIKYSNQPRTAPFFKRFRTRDFLDSYRGIVSLLWRPKTHAIFVATSSALLASLFRS